MSERPRNAEGAVTRQDVASVLRPSKNAKGKVMAKACNRPAPLQRNREPKALAQTITCPDCGLLLHVTDDTEDFKFAYDMKEWRGICTRVHLGDAAWCLVLRDGTQLKS
jgi:hypothetical protein